MSLLDEIQTAAAQKSRKCSPRLKVLVCSGPFKRHHAALITWVGLCAAQPVAADISNSSADVKLNLSAFSPASPVQLSGQDAFGQNLLSTSVASSYTVVGQGVGVGPFAQVRNLTADMQPASGLNSPASSASLSYVWRVTTANPSDQSPVTVHVSMSGYIDGWLNVSGVSDLDGALQTASQLSNANSLLYVSSSGPQAVDVVYGYAFGASSDIPYAYATNPSTGQYLYDTSQIEYGTGIATVTSRVGDSSTSFNSGLVSFRAQYSRSFDLTVYANVEQSFMLLAQSFGYPLQYFYGGSESYDLMAFVDPTITVDASFSQPYRLEVSAIPTANPLAMAVPEPPLFAMLGIGIAGLMGRRLMRGDTRFALRDSQLRRS